MKSAMRRPEMVKALILDSGETPIPRGVKADGPAQFPIEIGYRIRMPLCRKISRAQRKTPEMLGLMVNDPNILAFVSSAKSTMPTLVVCGTKDMMQESRTRMIAENIPNARLVILPGDHFVAPNGRPAEFDQVVDEFSGKRFGSI